MIKIQSVQLDLGKEYKPLYNVFIKLGIERRRSCPHKHQEQGKIEQKHKHIVGTSLTLLAQAHLHLSFLWEAFHVAACLTNKLPTPILEHISWFQKLYQKVPNYNLMKVCGCAFFPMLTNTMYLSDPPNVYLLGTVITVRAIIVCIL